MIIMSVNDYLSISSYSAKSNTKFEIDNGIDILQSVQGHKNPDYRTMAEIKRNKALENEEILKNSLDKLDENIRVIEKYIDLEKAIGLNTESEDKLVLDMKML